MEENLHQAFSIICLAVGAGTTLYLLIILADIARQSFKKNGKT